MTETPALVVFDIDDTLYLERDYVRSGFETVDEYLRASHGVDGFAAKAWALFELGVRGRIFDQALQQLRQPELLDRVPHLVRVYREHCPGIRLLPEVNGVIAGIGAQCSLAIISDGPANSQRRKLEALGLPNLIKDIILTNEHGEDRAKPNPWAYEELERRFRVPGCACVYLGDNPAKDFIGARGRGWRTVRVRRNGGLHFHAKAEPGYEADFEATTLKDSIARLGLKVTTGRCRL